jgi:hypothetical protein
MDNSKNQNSSDLLESLSETVDQLDEIFHDHFDLLQDQTNAVIHSDVDRVIELTEKHMQLQKEYKNRENDFVEELKCCLNPRLTDSAEVNLEMLKDVYPEKSSWIDEVRMKLSEHTSNLAERQQQLVDLLEFALVQNSKLMYSIFNNSNRKRMHYGSGGDVNSAQSGVAVNREV